MPKFTKEDLLKKLSDKLGTDDESLEILEAVSDSMEPVDVTGYEQTIAELNQKVIDTEENWRAKYKARFTEYTPEPEPEVPPTPEPEEVDETSETIEDIVEQIKL